MNEPTSYGQDKVKLLIQLLTTIFIAIKLHEIEVLCLKFSGLLFFWEI